MSFSNAGSPMQGDAMTNENYAPRAACDPEVQGLRALPGVTYVSVSDEDGRMDDDLFDLLLEEEAPAR